MPPLAAEYAPCPTLPMSPAPDDVLMMRRVDRRAGLRLRPPVLGGVPGRCEVALQVHADHRVPLVLARREEHAVAHEARVVHEDVEPAEGVDRGLHERARALPVGDVVGVGDRLAAQRRRSRRRRPARARVSAPVPSRATPRSFTTTVRALACERERVLAADAAPRAGDDDDPAVTDAAHGCKPYRWP